jgi:Zn-dependent protease
MIKPVLLEREDRPTVITRIFGVPLVVKSWTGLPVLELVAWVISSWLTQKKRPDWSEAKQAGAGAFMAMILFGLEWCHNLAHTLVASRIGKPVDAIRIVWGTPLLIYYDINDEQVLPHQHILRAVGGPIFNAILLPILWLAKRDTSPGTLARYLADFALGTDAVLSTISLLPIPGIDGGPILKWSLVKAGSSPEQADAAVKSVNRYLGVGLAAASGLAAKKRKKWLAVGATALAATSLAIGFGLLKEQK